VNEPTKSNGHIKDDGLLAIREAFKDAQFLNEDAFDAACLMKMGIHRQIGIPDSAMMEAYGTLTEGKSVQFTLKAKGGSGYIANLESYFDLVQFMQGKFDVEALP
jgi:hypothetical protein